MSATATATKVKERPIIFSGPMVKAILEGRKTQTRRVITPLPERDPFPCQYVYSCKEIKCPFAADRLWVRETWAPHDDSALANEEREYVYYRADDEKKYETDGAWRPSIFMPRWASRINLGVLQIRAERLQEISEADAIAEGLTQWSDPPRVTQIHYGETISDVWETDPRKAYARLWDTINAKRGYSWESNPWVWVIEFKKL